MKKLLLLMALVFSFIVGFTSSICLSEANYEIPLNDVINREKISPSDMIKENQIKIYDDKVVIYVDNPQWASYIDTNSMDPVLDSGANGLEMVPQSPNDVNIGDIATYSYKDDLVVHRVIDKKFENDSYWYLFKGDNNSTSDGWIEFNDIKYVTWGVIY